MQQLQFDDLDEGGRLVLVGEDGTHYAVAVDDRLRAAIRARPRSATPGRGQTTSVTPREVQAMIRAGQTAEEVASGTGWELARVRRFEGPVLAEREHVVGLAKAAHVRAAGRTDGSHTLERRVRERLQARGVQPHEVGWDAARTGVQGPWTVQVTFPAGGRERRAVWHYSVQDRSIEALDDEARWLSEDEQALPGGLEGHPLLRTSHAEDETADLMATMRERRHRRGRRPRRPETSEGDPAHVPGQQAMPEEVLPLADLRFDPDTMGDPPAAHPRGSAPEAPQPVQPPEEDEHDEEFPEDDEEFPEDDDGRVSSDRTSGPGSRRERRRLRIPRLATPVGDPPEEDRDAVAEQADHAHARRADPQEVSFEEFFGTDDEGDPVDDDVVDHADELGSDDDHEGDLADDHEDGLGSEDEPVPDGLQEGADPDDERAAPGADAASGDVPAVADDPTDQPEAGSSSPQGSRRKAKGRPSVPSWDDIMFGAADRKR